MIFKSPYPDVAIPVVSLTHYFLQRIAAYGGRPALIDGPSDRTITYAALAFRIHRAAAGLHRRRFAKGHVFAIYSPNVPEYAIAFHAVALLGGTVTTINPLYTAAEINKQLRDSGAVYLVTIGQFLDNARQAADGTGVTEIFTFDAAAGTTPFASLEVDGPVPEVSINAKTDVVVLPYSSGTTGLPKGVMLTHHNIVGNIVQTEGITDFDLVTSTDRVIGVLPFYHIYGMVVIMNMALVRGATIVTMPRFDMVQFLELIQKHKITRCNVVPPVLVGLAKHPLVDKYDTSSLIELFSGAAPLGQELAQEVTNRLGCSVVQGYGLTETSPITHVYNRAVMKGEKLGSIGLPLPNTEVMIADVETGAPLGRNERGELWVRGPQVMKGYLNNAAATAATLDADGWLHTGDIALADDDGMFFIVDRLKELIKYKGYQVAPAELEALLLTHPAIADAAVVPLPDAEAGEVPKAFLVLRAGQSVDGNAVMEWVATRVAAQKKIRAVEFIDAIPKTASGKILRRVLKARA